MKKLYLIILFALFTSSLSFAKNLPKNPLHLADTSGFSVTNDADSRPPEDAISETKNADGTSTKVMFDGSEVTTQSNGTQTTKYQNGASRTVNPDGSQILKDERQNEIQNYANGTQVIKKVSGEVIKTDAQGKKTTLENNGTLIQTDLKKGDVYRKYPDGTTEISK